MNTADSRNGYRDLFNRGTLELTFRILRPRYPALALKVQNALVTGYARDDYHTGLTAAELRLDSATIERISNALSMLANEVPEKRPSAQRTDPTLIRSLLLDWLMLARYCTQPAA